MHLGHQVGHVGAGVGDECGIDFLLSSPMVGVSVDDSEWNVHVVPIRPAEVNDV
jgi:hypothetical protein